jgi:hypothetical protein
MPFFFINIFSYCLWAFSNIFLAWAYNYSCPFIFMVYLEQSFLSMGMAKSIGWLLFSTQVQIWTFSLLCVLWNYNKILPGLGGCPNLCDQRPCNFWNTNSTPHWPSSCGHLFVGEMTISSPLFGTNLSRIQPWTLHHDCWLWIDASHDCSPACQ